VHEFWRMFIEHDSNCIVQLHTIADVDIEHDSICIYVFVIFVMFSRRQNVRTIFPMIMKQQ
jgi:hypothetical protein